MEPPEKVSWTGFFVGMVGPKEGVGLRGCLMRPGGVNEDSSVLTPPAWNRAIMAFTSALFAWKEWKRIRKKNYNQNTKAELKITLGLCRMKNDFSTTKYSATETETAGTSKKKRNPHYLTFMKVHMGTQH